MSATLGNMNLTFSGSGGIEMAFLWRSSSTSVYIRQRQMLPLEVNFLSLYNA